MTSSTANAFRVGEKEKPQRIQWPESKNYTNSFSSQSQLVYIMQQEN